jgi:hypothetical protein
MKMQPVKVIEVEDEGMISLLGKQVEIRCNVYIYTGILLGVNTTCIKLGDAAIVYETGSFTNKVYKDAQRLGGEQYVAMGLIESFGESFKGY